MGVLLILVSGAAFGAMAVLARVAYRTGTDPGTLLFLRFLLAGLALAVYMWARRIRFPRGRLLLILALMGGVWYFIQSLAYYTALTVASAGLVVLLLYLYPAMVVLISAVILREPLSRPKLVSLGLALAGTFLTIGPGQGGEVLGVLLALSAAVLYAGYVIVGGKVMEQTAAIPATTVVTLSAALSFGGLVASQGPRLPELSIGWAATLGTAACCLIALCAFFAGIERVGPANAAILSTVEPLVAVVLAAFFLGERIAPVRLVGGLCILLAVAFLARAELVRT